MNIQIGVIGKVTHVLFIVNIKVVQMRGKDTIQLLEKR